jgi:hypothetical protein
VSNHPKRDTGRAWAARYVTSVARAGRPTRATLAQLLAGFRARGQAAIPSQRWLAARLHVADRTIRRWLKTLEADGLLDVTRHAAHHDPITGRWRRRTNRYRCRFKTKRASMTGKDQVTPSGHSCPQNAPTRGVVDAAALVGADPPEPATGLPWLKAGITAREWTLKQMGRP